MAVMHPHIRRDRSRVTEIRASHGHCHARPLQGRDVIDRVIVSNRTADQTVQTAALRKEGIETSSTKWEAPGFVSPAQDEREREGDRSCLALDEGSQNYEKGTSRPDEAGHGMTEQG